MILCFHGIRQRRIYLSLSFTTLLYEFQIFLEQMTVYEAMPEQARGISSIIYHTSFSCENFKMEYFYKHSFRDQNALIVKVEVMAKDFTTPEKH